MRIQTCNVWKRMKATLLTGLTAGVVLASACTVTDVRHNVVAGTQSFIQGYATDLVEAWMPSPHQLISGAAAQ